MHSLEKTDTNIYMCDRRAQITNKGVIFRMHGCEAGDDAWSEVSSDDKQHKKELEL